MAKIGHNVAQKESNRSPEDGGHSSLRQSSSVIQSSQDARKGEAVSH